MPPILNAERAIALGLHRTAISDAWLSLANDLGVTHLDTAYNYGGFKSLDHLGRLGAAVNFMITSKVGYFEAVNGSGYHSLEPRLLARSVEGTIGRLGAPLDAILLHNPEEAVETTVNFPRAFALACEAMQRAVDAGFARRWGLSTWRPNLFPQDVQEVVPRPQIVMTRVGFSVNPAEMQAIRRCRRLLASPGIEYRGMAPFGGELRSTSLLGATDLTSFITGEATNAQAAIRVSFDLPAVEQVTFATSDPAHLKDAVDACHLEVDRNRVEAYMAVLDAAYAAPQPDSGRL